MNPRRGVAAFLKFSRLFRWAFSSGFLKACAQWVLSIALIAFLALKTDLPSLWKILSSVNLYPAIIAIGLGVLTHYLNAVKVFHILPDEHPLSKGRLTAINFAGTFLNNLLPTRIGGDVARIFFINKKLSSKRISIAVVLIDRLSGFVVQTMLVLFSGAFLSGPILSVHSKVFCGVSLCLLCCAVFLPRLYGVPFVKKSASALMRLRYIAVAIKPHEARVFLKSFFTSPGRIAKTLFAGIVFQCCVIASVMELTTAFGGTISFFESAWVSFAGTIACFLAPSIGGWGVMEGSFTYLYRYLHLQGSVGLAVSLGLRITMIIPSIIGWVVFIRSEKMKT
jgi:uncharacterized protein (TIRG00374 family)